ncbi:MAG: DNA cytosine methyltransferase, partial [bacterium]
MKPLAIDLYCGLGGWTEGFLAEGYRCIGFDVERHDYGTGGYPGQLVLQDVTTLHGSQFRDAACIVASPPCQEYSYRAMPWKRAKALPPPDNTLFEACFRIQQEASAAAGHRIPLVIENVKGAQRWVGRARWHFGSYYLWGDVPALMPICLSSAKVAGQNWSHFRKRGEVSPHWRLMGLKTVAHINQRNGHSHTRHLTDPREACGIKQIGSGAVWFDTGIARLPSNCDERRRAAALI